MTDLPLSLSLRTPREMASELGQRIARLRLARDWKRATLAERSGVPEPTLKRFETTGQGSLETLLKLAQALDGLEQFEPLLALPQLRTIAEIEQRMASKTRKRGRL